MPPIRFSVNVFCAAKRTFSSIFIWFVTKELRWLDGARAVKKTRVDEFVWLVPRFPPRKGHFPPRKGQSGGGRKCTFPPDLAYWTAMRTLAIRPGAIGDLILSLPALECLNHGFLEVWTAGAAVPLVRFADRVRSIRSTGIDLLGVAAPPPALLPELRGFDRIVSWYGANRPDFVGLTRSLELPFEFLRALPPDGAGGHAADFFLGQVAALGDCHGRPARAVPRLPCSALRGDFAAIHPFSGSPRKNWPLARFRALARAIGRLMPVRWCAGPEDPPLAGAVRIDNLYDLACWLAQARLYIGNDSGITHLAAAAGAPVLALFGPTDPGVWAPRGPHVRVVRWPTDAATALTVD